jgi:hypothetical protein
LQHDFFAAFFLVVFFFTFFFAAIFSPHWIFSIVANQLTNKKLLAYFEVYNVCQSFDAMYDIQTCYLTGLFF